MKRKPLKPVPQIGLTTTRIERRIRKYALLGRGLKPARKLYIWRIEVLDPTFLLPGWAAEYRVKNFSADDQVMWTRNRGVMREIVAILQANKVEREVNRVEWRKCRMCGKQYVGSEATRLRVQDEATKRGERRPCDRRCRKRKKQ